MSDRHTVRPNHIQLFEIASEQRGYFTATQARTCGFNWDVLTYHTRTGRFVRVRRGLYRLRDYPSSRHEEVVTAWLAVGKDVAVVSHESALDLLGLGDVIPDAVHLTVPRSRRNLPFLPGAKIHTSLRPLRQDDRIIREGVPLTSANRAILDAAEAGTAPEQIEMAVAQAIQRGMATEQQLRQDAARRGRRTSKLIDSALRKVVR